MESLGHAESTGQTAVTGCLKLLEMQWLWWRRWSRGWISSSKKGNIRALKKWRHLWPERRVNKMCSISVALLRLSVPLNSHFTPHDDTHAQADTDARRASLRGLENRPSLEIHSGSTTLCCPLVRAGVWKPQTTSSRTLPVRSIPTAPLRV